MQFNLKIQKLLLSLFSVTVGRLLKLSDQQGSKIGQPTNHHPPLTLLSLQSTPYPGPDPHQQRSFFIVPLDWLLWVKRTSMCSEKKLLKPPPYFMKPPPPSFWTPWWVLGRLYIESAPLWEGKGEVLCSLMNSESHSSRHQLLLMSKRWPTINLFHPF